jgi:putative transposase
MSHTLVVNYQHIIFSTKERTPTIPRDLMPELWPYFGGVARKHGYKLLARGGITDHVHLLVALPGTASVSDAAQRLKANSSRWLRQRAPRFPGWQEGFSSFSVSASNLNSVREYILNQEEHHKRRDFGSELNALLAKHGVENS